ncbi:MAG: hypothetical protein WAS21_27735 [Geminicoccaceae bacterium]
MHKLAIPQTYVSGASDDDPRLRVIAVQPRGSAEAALQALVIAERGCALGLASLARAQPELAVTMYRLIDELDGLAYRHPEQGLLPLAGEPLCQNLPAVWPDVGADGAPDPDTVAEWLTWFGDDAQRWWGGLSVTTDRGHWQLGDPRPVRTILAEATTCRITRQPDATQVTELILSRLPAATAEALRQAIAGVRAVHELEAPLFAAEARDLLQQARAHVQLEAQLRPRLEPPPTSTQPRLPIVITHVLHPETPTDADELTGDIQSHNAEVQSFVLLEPIGRVEAALDACVPPGREARRRLDEVALTAPELGSLACRIADHLDGLARTGKAGLEPVPMAGIVLHSALGELLRYPHDDLWEQAVTLYRGMWLAVSYHLAGVRVETPDGGIWTSSRPMRLRDVLAGQERCTITRPEEGDGTFGHACLDHPISSELSRRWRRQALLRHPGLG